MQSKQRLRIVYGIVLLAVIAGALCLVGNKLLRKENIEQPADKLNKPNKDLAVAKEVEVDQGFLSFEPVDWTNPEKPMESSLLQESEIPKEAIAIQVSAKGFSPSFFEAKKGEKLVLSVSNKDDKSHSFMFRDPGLAKVAIGVSPGENRAITFFAPEKSGEYEFYCDIKGHKEMGEKGKMVVK